jgi:hypothetical protein
MRRILVAGLCAAAVLLTGGLAGLALPWLLGGAALAAAFGWMLGGAPGGPFSGLEPGAGATQLGSAGSGSGSDGAAGGDGG